MHTPVGKSGEMCKRMWRWRRSSGHANGNANATFILRFSGSSPLEISYNMENPRDNAPVRDRVTAACDACRARKVKVRLRCYSSSKSQSHKIQCRLQSNETNCSGCKELGIDCTTMKPRKRRGPKNHYVHALRAQLDAAVGINTALEDQDLSVIAHNDTIDQVITDWFDWLHPVAPILHRGIFLQRVYGSSDLKPDRSVALLLLLASIGAATVASLRRRRPMYGALTVNSCLELAERFNLWSLASNLTLDRALTLYNLSTAVIHEFGIDFPLAHRLLSESSATVKYLLHYKINEMSFMDQQLLKRLYWLIYAGQCTCDMHGRQLLLLRQAHEPITALLPLAISDEQLLDDAARSVPEQSTMGRSYVPGLLALSGLFSVWHSSQATSEQTLENLHEHISRAQRTLSDLPPEITLAGCLTHGNEFGFSVQKVNLKVTQLHIRSNLLEQMNAIANNQGFHVTPDIIIDERHFVVEELLDALYTMPEEVFEANGYSIVPKIRDIGSALFDELRTGTHGRTLQASISLDRLLAKLQHLDLQPISETPYFS